MRQRRRSWLIVPALMLVAACGDGGGENVANTAGDVSADDALGNAAEMLDASPDSLAAPANMALETESAN